ncbi:MAG: metallophosphoesterase [Cyanobacteria bacterium P01_A01_bin.83]
MEPNWIEVVPIPLAIPHLEHNFNNFKVVQISDLHLNKFMPAARIAKTIELVNQQQADAIAITGDFITQGQDFEPNQLIFELSKLESKLGTFAVLGNHDHWGNNIELLIETLKQNKINLLNNQVFMINRDEQKLALAGLDDPYWGDPNLSKIIAQLSDNPTAILLVHEPDYIEKSAKTHKFALQLSGHSHGGQIKIPFLAPLILPYGARKYFAGLEQVEDTITYTNRGLGMTGLPLRFGSRPEITVFTLHSAS